MRVLAHLGVALALLAGSLAGGMIGFVHFEGLAWNEAFLETAMLLSGMGPTAHPTSAAGTLFAGVFALYAGLVFIVVAGLLLSPGVHRILHRFHWDDVPAGSR